jgi:VWFA-related protein
MRSSCRKNFIFIFVFITMFSLALIQFSRLLLSQAEVKPLRYEVEVVLIEIPLYVVDKEGNPVEDLKPEEISLYENGKKQEISHFVLVQNDSPQMATISRKYPAARRQILLFFDLAFSAPAGIIKAREACLDFIKEKILPTDLVGVASYSGIGGLKILSHFSNDREHLFDIINTLGLIESKQRMTGPVGFTFPRIDQPARDETEADSFSPVRMADDRIATLQQQLNKRLAKIQAANVTDFISALNTLSVALNTIQGRKHIIYFSEGFDSKVLTGKAQEQTSVDTGTTTGSKFVSRYVLNRYIDTASQFGDAALRTQLDGALNKIASADCSIHTVDIGGLKTQAGNLNQVNGQAASVSSIHRRHATLTTFSKETGGQIFRNINELDQPLENLLKVTNTYYVIGYYPEDKKKEGKFRKIKIQTSRSGVDVSYRKGYYEAKPYSKYTSLEKRLQLVEYIVKDLASSEIQFESCVFAFRGRESVCQVPVLLKFSGGQFLEKNRKEIELEIFGYAISSSGFFKDFFHQTLIVSPQKLKKELQSSGVKYYDLHLLSPGDYKIKLIVRDRDTGEIGSQIQKISVPDYEKGDLAVSGPVFIQPGTDWLLTRGFDPLKPSGRKMGVNLPLDYPFIMSNKSFIPGVIPVLKASTPAQFYLKVYNLKLHPQAQVPRTEMSFEMVDGEGKSTPLKNVEFLQNPLQVKLGEFDLFFKAKFESFIPGYYWLKLTFKDLLANQEVASRVPFVLE